MADAKTKESRAKTQEAKTSTGLQAAEAVFTRTKREAEKVAKGLEMTKNQQKALGVVKEEGEKKFAAIAGDKAKTKASQKIAAAFAKQAAAAAKLQKAQKSTRAMEQRAL